MKKIYFLLFTILATFSSIAQKEALPPTSISQAEYVLKIPALSQMENIISADGFEHVAPPKRRGSNTFVPGKGLPNGVDPLAQEQENTQTRAGRAPLVSFIGHQGSVLNDPTGAIGPNHYVYAFNSGFGIKDRNGNVLLAEASLGTLFPGETLGDPIVIYDQFADRFLIMEFSNTPNGFLIAVCQGADPVNDGWYTYRFNTGAFPDYEKMSIWGDGYYVTANKSSGSTTTSDVVFALERDEMLLGNAAQMVGFPLPSSTTSGFYSPGGFNVVGNTLPPAGEPAPIVYMQDDSWSGVSTDHLKIWNISVNWASPGSSSISSPQVLNTASFDGVFNGGSFQNLNEPGSGPNIDALQATMMYMTNYRRFATHNSAVMNFVVDISGNDTKAGIRWFELRQSADGQPWTIYQEGTYSQPDHSAFCGSINMDVQGNIGLAYTIVSDTKYTSLRYTGRLAGDPLNTMTLAEQTIVDGTKKTNRSDGRYGDYAQLTMDPLDDLTFWHIGEYMKGSNPIVRKSQVASFILATGPTVLNESYFETGWDGWEDGGGNAYRYSGSKSYEGDYSIRLRKNTTASTMTLGDFDVTSYSSITIDFYSKSQQVDAGEGFLVQFWDGGHWRTVGDFNRPTDFNNKNSFHGTVTFDSSTYTFPVDAKFRFRCNTDTKQDRVYIDQVLITASTTLAPIENVTTFNQSPITPLVTHKLNTEETTYSIYPNPTQSNLEIKTKNGENIGDIMIFSMFGNLVKTINNTTNSISIDVSNLTTGTYFIRFISNGKITTKKFVKK